MTPREERGLVIAATQKLTQKGKIWIVPSQTGSGRKYTVHPDSESPFCSCPDFEETGCRCKHLIAVETVMNRETAKDGTVTETRSITFTEKRVYTQDWPNYNLAQIEEKRRFLALLFDLCKGVEDPPVNTTGRKRTPMADMIFAAALKVYTTFSSRRFGTDLEEATAKGYISHKLHPVMVNAFLEKELLTPVLRDLIRVSSTPLRAVETEFAVDSSGFSASRFVRWTDEKYGVERSGRDWVKCHIACGVKTHVITAVEIRERDAGDAPLFGPLVKATRETFKIKEVSADKGYLSAENVDLTFACGGTPFIAFKANSTGAAGGLFEKMFHYYSLNRDEFMAHYHKRSNVESVFSMLKAKFRDHVRSKKDVAMKNEVLCKILCHNICCLIMSQCELGIAPVFWKDESGDVPEVQPVPQPTEMLPELEAVSSRPQTCVGA
jgi:transposase/predicted nucleic acid-binding Zn finger protein